MSGTSKIIILIISLGIGYVFVYSPAKVLPQLMEQKQNDQKYLDTIGSIESKKDELLTKYDNISQDYRDNINTVLPDSLDFIRLVSELDSVAANYGISIGKMTSRETSKSVGSTVENAQPEKIYNSAAVGFSFTTSYDNFKSFMSRLEKSLRILDIKSVKISEGEKGTYSFDVEFETYWLKPL
jgi:hypothetical protein